MLKPGFIRLSSESSAPPERVDRDARTIYGLSAITHGPAKGHGFWIDQTMLEQVTSLAKQVKSGPMACYSHGGPSDNQLTNYLGRTKEWRMDGNQVRYDMHFRKAADPQKVEQVMAFAEDDPEACGPSIVFLPDTEAEAAFRKEHSVKQGDQSVFISPDPDNKSNLPHARAKALDGVDIVYRPAANPSGMFSELGEMDLATGASEWMRYLLGVSDESPTYRIFEHIAPEQMRAWLTAFCAEQHIAIVQLDGECETELAPKKSDVVTCPKCGHEFKPGAKMSEQQEPEVSSEPEPAEEPATSETPETPAPIETPPAADPPVADTAPGRERNEAVIKTIEFLTTEQVRARREAEELGAISYRKAHPDGTPLEENRGATWDGGAETKAATVDDLKKMCAFVSDGRENIKSGYKLPHHRAAGQHACVFRGVSQAAGRMDQVSDMTPGARRVCRGHLQEHYHEFGEKAPWERNSAAWATYEQLCEHRSVRGGMSDDERAAALRMLGFELEADALQNVVELTTAITEAVHDNGKLTDEQRQVVAQRMTRIESLVTELTGRLP